MEAIAGHAVAVAGRDRKDAGMAIDRRLLRILLVALFFVTVFCAKSWMVGRYGSSMPYWDQWGGESALLLKSRSGELSASDLISSHNEHRILMSRLFWLAVFHLNGGQWDNLPECYGMALISSFTATFLTFAFLHACGWRSWMPVLLFSLLLNALPLGWLNLLWGFQIQFHAQLLLAILAMYGLGICMPWRFGWWVGAIAAFASLFTAGSGYLVACSVLLLSVLRIWRWGEGMARHLPSIAVSLAVFCAGFLLLERSEASERYRAGTIGEFALSAMRNLAWPWPEHPWVAIVLYLPLLLLLAGYFLPGGFRAGKGTDLVLLIGSYAVSQMLAIAFSRGIGGLAPHFRYYDLHVLGIFAGFGAIFLARSCLMDLPSKLRPAMRLFVPAWMVCVLLGLLAMASGHLRTELPEWRRMSGIQTENVRGHLEEGGTSHLFGKGRVEIPHGSPEGLAAELGRAGLRDILPWILREPVALAAEEASGSFRSKTLGEEAGLPSDGFVSCHLEEGGRGKYVSEAIHARHGYLFFRYAGFPATGNLSLAVRGGGEDGRRVPFREEDGKKPERGWRPLLVPAGSGAIRIEAEDRRDGGWFAFTWPHDVGRLTAWSLWLGEAAGTAATVSLALLGSTCFVLSMPGHLRRGARL